MINFQYFFSIVIVTFQQALTVLKIDHKGKIKIKTRVNKSWIVLWSLKPFLKQLFASSLLTIFGLLSFEKLFTRSISEGIIKIRKAFYRPIQLYNILFYFLRLRLMVKNTANGFW